MKWDLSKLYSGFEDPDLPRDLDTIERNIGILEEMTGKIRNSGINGENLTELISVLEDDLELQGKVGSYVFLSLAADSGCEEALAPRTRFMKAENHFSVVYSELVRLIGSLKPEELNTVLKQYPALERYRSAFERMREDVLHLMDPALEKTVLEMQLSGGKAWGRLRDELFAGQMIEMQVDGETKKLPLSEVRGMAYDPSAEIREKAYQAEIAAYPRMETAMAACLNGIKGEARLVAKLRNYDSILDWSLDLSHMNRALLNRLLDTMEKSMPMFRKYLRLKQRMLGGEGGLRFQDLFAPVVQNAKRYTLDEAKELLYEVFDSYHKPIADVMRCAFTDAWIDAYPREGKEGGAFCAGMHKERMSYVLTNFVGSYSDVSTLAHELGHAYHNSRMYDVPVLLTDTPMPLAETASTFNELLLSEKILSNADRETSIAILEAQLSDATQVIVDIMSRFRFESEVVDRRADKELTARELCEIMVQAQKDTYGDGLDENYLHPYMWACKSHYYDTDYHFYNYPYAFGQLFGAGLYRMYMEKGEEFWPIYDRLLSDSGSGTVQEVSAAAGIDLMDAKFWEGSIAFFADKLARLQALTEE